MKKAVVLVSGGLDSATVLAMAKQQGYACFALNFDYGQRHSAELNAAKTLCKESNTPLKTFTLDLTQLGGSALTDNTIEVPTYQVNQTKPSIPVTYVPARNTMFLSIALGYAETLEAEAIFIGANAVDYSGYPDCRPEYIAAFEAMANLATKYTIEGKHLTIHTPLIALSKSEIISTGTALGVDYSKTVSCYQATEDGLACGQCESCEFRARGFKEAGLVDPTNYRN